MKALAVTGLGVCSPIGIGREAFFRALAGPVMLRDAPRLAVESFDTTRYAETGVAEVVGFDASRYMGDKGLRTLDRLTKLLIVATRLCTHDAGLKKDGAFVPPVTPERVGVIASNAYGSLEAITELDRVAELEDARYINPAKFPNTVANSASGYASIWEDLRALNVAVSDGNCGSLDAIACADIHITNGRADALVVGGAEAMSEALYLAFQRIGVLEAGTHLGEGAAMFCLETAELAAERGAKVLGWVAGCGNAFEAPANDRQMIHASTDAMTRAVRACLHEAGASPGDVDLVASGVSGLRAFDTAELAGIAAVLGDAVPVAAPKQFLGESLGAGGAMIMASALGWMQGIPAAAMVRGAAPPRLRSVLLTTMGYYGNASAALLRAP